MPESSKYCLKIDNIIYEPQYLPKQYKNMSNFDCADEETLKANGWYKYEDIIPPEIDVLYQTISRVLIQVDNTIRPSYKVNDIGLDELNELLIAERINLYDYIALKRWQRESNGINFKNHLFKADEYSQTKILAVYTMATQNDDLNINWKTGNGYISLNSEEIINLFNSLSNFIQILFEMERSLREQVDIIDNLKIAKEFFATIDLEFGKLKNVY